MLRLIFEGFKRKATQNNTFNACFYEAIQVRDGREPVFYMKICENMCDENGEINPAAIAAVIDGCTIITIMAKFQLFKEIVSVSMQTRYLFNAKVGEHIEVFPKVLWCDLTRGVINAEVFVNGKLAADATHNVFITKTPVVLNID